MIETEFTFLQVEIEGRRSHSPKARESGFGEFPEPFDSIDVGRTHNKLVLPVIHPEVFAVPNVDQAIIASIASPAIGVDNTLQGHFPPNDALEGLFGTIGNDLGIDFSMALEKAKDNALSKRAPTTLSFDPSRTEIGFVDLYLSRQEELCFTIQGNPFPEGLKESVHCIAV